MNDRKPTEADVKAHPTRVDRIAEMLELAIASGELAPGAKLGEEQLARQFSVSRAPLREALRKLEGRGLATRMPHAGVRVIQLTVTDAIELYQLRQVLECAVCRLAAQNMSMAQIDDLDRQLDRHIKQPEVVRGEHYRQRFGDEDFHYALAKGSGNRRLTRLLCEETYSLIRVVRFHMSATPGRAPDAHNDHRQIVAALRKRDGELAELLMNRHLEWALSILRNAEAPWFLPVGSEISTLKAKND